MVRGGCNPGENIEYKKPLWTVAWSVSLKNRFFANMHLPTFKETAYLLLIRIEIIGEIWQRPLLVSDILLPRYDVLYAVHFPIREWPLGNLIPGQETEHV